jgi:putative membrane protein
VFLAPKTEPPLGQGDIDMKATGLAFVAAAALNATSASAELPVPPMASATQQADAYLFHAGAGDIYEITSSMLAIQKSQNPAVRQFATMLIADHTNTTNVALANAKSAGVMPPPPELSPMQKDMISQLIAAGANFDRVYLQQQAVAHQQALAIQSGYASQGDVPSLRATATSAVPIIQGHLNHVQGMMRGR